MAGRPRSIDRDRLLDAAEALVAAAGLAGLSFDAVAREAGVTKSGVQYAFGTKDALIRAMIDRWGQGFDADVARRTGPAPGAAALVRGHLAATAETDEAEQSRSAVMMTALMHHPEQIATTRAWYNARVAGLDLTKPEDRRLSLAFLAGEGAFLLRAFGLIDMQPGEWQILFRDILALADGDETPE